MSFFAALLLAQAPAVVIPNLPRPRPRPANALASASVEVVRAERIGSVASPGGVLRQVRRVGRELVVEFD